MKNRYFKIFGATMLTILVLSACTKNFTEINTDPLGSKDALPEQLLAPALNNSLAVVMSRNHSFNNELMQVTVSQSDDEGAIFRYDYRNSVSDGIWNGLYSQLSNFRDVYLKASTAPNVNTSYQAISLIMQVWCFSILTDTYGDVPYSQATLGRDSLNFEPKFDAQKDIYTGMFQQLETANTLLSSGAPAIKASADPVYNGVVANWRKFGNSLYLRLLLRLTGKAEASAAAIAKIHDMVDVNASKYPKFASNADNAVLRWTGGVYTSPYQTIREQDWRSPAIGSFFIDHLVAWSDPRINISIYGSAGFNPWGIAQGPSGFAGVPSGYAPGTGATKQSYFYSNTSAVSLQTNPNTGILMNFAELEFILAEAKVKNYITTGVAQTYWETGVLNSLLYWVPTYPNATASGMPATATTINTPEFRTYLTAADISWDDTQTVDQKMEDIHLQKYYAMFLVDLQQWYEYRRTGHPTLPKGAGLRNGGVMPARMVYPVYVQSANPTSYKNAVAAQGTDAITTQVWWQKP